MTFEEWIEGEFGPECEHERKVLIEEHWPTWQAALRHAAEICRHQRELGGLGGHNSACDNCAQAIEREADQ